MLLGFLCGLGDADAVNHHKLKGGRLAQALSYHYSSVRKRSRARRGEVL